jgi:hypothetical protein
VITALRDTLNSKLTIVRLFTSVTNPYICLALCFEPFLNLRGKIEKIMYYTCFCKRRGSSRILGFRDWRVAEPRRAEREPGQSNDPGMRRETCDLTAGADYWS